MAGEPPTGGVGVRIDLRKAIEESKLPFVYANVVSASRVGSETALEFGTFDIQALASAIQSKKTEVQVSATLSSRLMLSPVALITLRKQLDLIADALIKENPQLAPMAEMPLE